jgi:hypothetical protein
MSKLTDIILITRKNDHGVTGLWNYLNVNCRVVYLLEVSGAVREHSQSSAWMGGVDGLDTQAFLDKFEKIQWESLPQVQLLLKHGGEATFTEHRPSSTVRDALRNAFQALMHDGAPEICDGCAECDQLFGCECEKNPTCHTVREMYIESQRQGAIKAIMDVLPESEWPELQW